MFDTVWEFVRTPPVKDKVRAAAYLSFAKASGDIRTIRLSSVVLVNSAIHLVKVLAPSLLSCNDTGVWEMSVDSTAASARGRERAAQEYRGIASLGPGRAELFKSREVL